MEIMQVKEQRKRNEDPQRNTVSAHQHICNGVPKELRERENNV